MDYLYAVFYTNSQFVDSNDEAESWACGTRAIYLALHPLQVILFWPILVRDSQGGLFHIFLSQVELLLKWEDTWANLNHITQ